MGVYIHGRGPGPGHGGLTVHQVGTSNTFGALEDTMSKRCSDGTNLAMTREKYECGVNSIMNDKSLRGPEGRLKLTYRFLPLA